MSHEHGHPSSANNDLSWVGLVGGIILLVIAFILLWEFVWGIICLVVGLSLVNRHIAKK